ncbi:MAG: hypothetical protein ACRDRH_01165 [Pseudonocardia sp.]
MLVFGENLNDSQRIRELLLTAKTSLGERRVKALPKPISLTREATHDAVRRWVSQLDKAVQRPPRRRAGRRLVVHRDADGPDTTGATSNQLEAQLSSIGGLPVVPVQIIIEAGWFLFPDAVEAVRPTAWRGRLPGNSHDVELIAKPKAELCRATRSERAPSTPRRTHP